MCDHIAVDKVTLCLSFAHDAHDVFIWYVYFIPAVCTGNCQNGGHCIRPNTCECRHGYIGPNCEHGTMYTGLFSLFDNWLHNSVREITFEQHQLVC